MMQGAGYDQKWLHHVCSVSINLIKAYTYQMKEFVDDLLAAGLLNVTFFVVPHVYERARKLT